MGYRIEVRDRNLKRIGEIDTWQKLDFVVRFNDVLVYSIQRDSSQTAMMRN